LTKFQQNLQEFKNQINNNICKYTITSFINPVFNFDKSAVLSEISSKFNKFFYWEQPEKQLSFIGFGNLIDISVNGNARFIETSDKIEKIRTKIVSNHNQFPELDIPFVLGGMKFSINDRTDEWADFNDSDWFVPEFLIISQNGKNFLTVNEKPDKPDNRLSEIMELLETPANIEKDKKFFARNISDENYEKNNWIKNVSEALLQIEKEHFTKIVISRRKDIKLDEKPVLHILLKKLSAQNPLCYIFAYGSRNSIFLGASPEKLVKYDKNFIEADGLAGSIARGNTAEEDKNLETELLSSKKNLAEQKSVVDFIVRTFNNFSNKINYPAQPVIKKLENIQHLFTPIKAEVDPDFNIFELISRIHPTPAICGAPCIIARSVLNDLENYKRGFYSGVIGWLNFNKQGEFAVGIRSALLNDKKLVVFAGCGIVKGSDPELEFREAELKMIPILSLFDYDNSN